MQQISRIVFFENCELDGDFFQELVLGTSDKHKKVKKLTYRNLSKLCSRKYTKSACLNSSRSFTGNGLGMIFQGL